MALWTVHTQGIGPVGPTLEKRAAWAFGKLLGCAVTRQLTFQLIRALAKAGVFFLQLRGIAFEVHRASLQQAQVLAQDAGAPVLGDPGADVLDGIKQHGAGPVESSK